jgi:hypothetical protein
MHYAVGLLLKSASQEADIKDVVRATDIEDAIVSFVKGRNIKYAYSAYVYPANKSVAVTKEWRWYIHCSVSGRVTMSRERKRS